LGHGLDANHFRVRRLAPALVPGGGDRIGKVLLTKFFATDK
jgi:hypothetical protein